MTDENVERRLNHVEVQQARQGEQLTRLQTDVGAIGAGVQQLLKADAGRPAPTNARAVVAVVGSLFGLIGGMALFSWWFISVSPIVQDLDRRMTRLDDHELGRVQRLERQMGWRPTVAVKP